MNFQERQLETIIDLERCFRQGLTPSTIVPLMSNPADDDRLCLTAVAFLPQVARERLQNELIAPLQAHHPQHYFYLPESLHVTIQNVRSIASPPNFSEGDLNIAQEVFASTMARHKPFSFQLKRLFELPTSIAVCAFSNERLQLLVDDLRAGLITAKLPDDKRYAAGAVFGNVTVCRFQSEPSDDLKKCLIDLKNIDLGEILVEEIALITTNAVCHPHKTRIVDMFRFSLVT